MPQLFQLIYHMKPSRHVCLIHVVPMRYAANKMELAHVNAFLNILEIRMKDVVPNVYIILTVNLILPVFETNVKIHVPEPVVKMLNVA